MKELKTVEVTEEWRKDWATPDVYMFNNYGEKFYLREHTVGLCPIVWCDPKRKFEYYKETSTRYKKDIQRLNKPKSK